MNIVYMTTNKSGSQGHFYDCDGILVGFSEDDEEFVIESQEEVMFFGNLCDRALYELPLDEFLDMVQLDYTAFSEVDKMQGYLMSGLPENPVLPSEA